MSYIWFTALGMLVCVVIGLIASFITGATDPSKINPGLICPLFDELLPCLPAKLRRRLHFGVRHQDFVKFSPSDPRTMKRGGYDKTVYITKDDEIKEKKDNKDFDTRL